MTGAIVRITDDPRASEEEAMVEVCGTFTATQVRVCCIVCVCFFSICMSYSVYVFVMFLAFSCLYVCLFVSY